jgi:DNA-binding LacI/PurR family transcriptional regulator
MVSHHGMKTTATKNVTVEDVARKCGLSRATVSRVINGAARVRPATVERVQRAITKLGYHPNAHARALSGGASGTLAVLLRGGAWRPYFSTLLEGIEEVASREGRHVLLRSRDYLAAAPRLVEEGRVDGFIIRNMDEPEAHRRLAAHLAGRDVPFVLIGDSLGDWPSITIDNVGGARAMARHFVGHGFRRILFIAGPPRHVDSTDRLYGFKMGLSEHGLDPDSVELADGDFSTPSGFNAMRASSAGGRYDAVFAANDRMALGAILYLRQAGLRVPEDVAVAGFDDTFFTEYVSPALTTVRQPFRELGVTAMETMNLLMAGSPAPSRHVILPTTLVVRASCGCRYAEHNPPILEDRLVLS